MKIKNGDTPAMPLPCNELQNDYEVGPFGGLTKREQFAMAAMKGILSNPYWNEYGEYTPTAVASASMEYTDALLAELENQQ